MSTATVTLSGGGSSAELQAQFNDLSGAFLDRLEELQAEPDPARRSRLLLAMRVCRLAQANVWRLGMDPGVDGDRQARLYGEMARTLTVLAECEQARAERRERRVLWPELEPLIGDALDVLVAPMAGNPHAALIRAAVVRDVDRRLDLVEGPGNHLHHVRSMVAVAASGWEALAEEESTVWIVKAPRMPAAPACAHGSP